MNNLKAALVAMAMLLFSISVAHAYTFSFISGAPAAQGPGYVEFMNTAALTNTVPGTFDFDGRSSFTSNTEFIINPGETGTASFTWNMDLSGLLEAYGYFAQSRSQYTFVLYKLGGDNLLYFDDLLEDRVSTLGPTSVNLDVHESGMLNLDFDTRYAFDLYFWNTVMAEENEQEPVGAYANVNIEEALFRFEETSNGTIPTPEPATALLLLLGLPALIPLSRKR